MPKKTERKDLQGMLKRAGARQPPSAEANVTEIRSCGNMKHHKKRGEKESAPKSRIADLVIIWEYSVDYYLSDDFHKFLADSEDAIERKLAALGSDARYLGTYIRHSGSTPRYRTIWAYGSFEAMLAVWAKVVSGADNELRDLASTLRSYWLRDPNRSEARWIPAQDVSFDESDAPFARITIEAHKKLRKGG